MTSKAEGAVMFSGPMFTPVVDGARTSVQNKEGAHYNTYATRDQDSALAFLRECFPNAKSINAMNFVLFSTSGIHGSYKTIEEVDADIIEYGDVEREDDDDRPSRYVTYLLVQPRIVSMTYGNCACRTLADVKFLKQLRRWSWKAVEKIGAP